MAQCISVSMGWLINKKLCAALQICILTPEEMYNNVGNAKDKNIEILIFVAQGPHI